MSKRGALYGSVLVIVAAAAYGLISPWSYRPEQRFFTIVVWQADSGGPCSVVAVRPEKDGFAVRGDTVHWDIVGRCHGGKVGIGAFSPADGAANTPSPVGAPAPGPVGGRVTATVIPKARLTKYEYSIFIDGVVAMDPEIQIKGRP
jgi:hypothetical protein